MYSDDESVLSSHSGSSGELQRASQKQRLANTAGNKDGSDDAVPTVEESEESAGDRNAEEEADGGYHGAVQPSTVPIECLERCAVFIDAAFFDVHLPSEDPNEQVVECCMQVVECPFVRPATTPSETMLYTPVISATNMTKIQRARTVQRWEQQIATRHGIPCTPQGTSTGFEELQKTNRAFQAHIRDYRQTMSKLRNRGSAHLTVALDEADMQDRVSNMLWDTVSAAVKAGRQESPVPTAAFLTTAKRYDDVCQALLWLQRTATVSLPRYDVFTIATVLGQEWDDCVTKEMESNCCGYHDYLMTNLYGNRRHCCESTVTAISRVLATAVSDLA